ncbi:non-ribosomal peptide synthetase, partial [Noviherbaspirillum sp.]|uniref:non-ribosomal peptide synthetase n=1 Tax=Noviherbaspirillum sp. TaxID=1926288 RepID=UPI002FE22853
QEGILFHHLMESEGDVYLSPTLFSFDSRERLDRFLQALQAVIDRHDILRTAIHWEGLAEPVQVVWRSAPLQVDQPVLDGGQSPIADQLRRRYDPRHYRVDVRQAPLMRIAIAEDAANGRWLMLHLLHHLSIDHTTLDALLVEVRALLLSQGDTLSSPQPFRNFVAEARLGVGRAEHEAYFRALLADVNEPTLPYGMSDARGNGEAMREAQRQVDAEIARQVRAKARALNVSVASLCHVAWAQVLARLSNRDDVVFGTVLFGRMQAGGSADRVLGMFINTLPVRVRLDNQTVAGSVQQTHAQLTQLLRHEHASLSLAQRCSAVAAPAPLFTAILNYRYSTEPAIADDKEHEQPWEGMQSLGGEELSNYPVSLDIDDLGAGLKLTAQVRMPADPAHVCDLMHTALAQLANALDSAPSVPIASLDILPEAERKRLLVDWNATESEFPESSCLHQLFEAQAAYKPDALAVCFENFRLTYGELNAQANRFVHHLRSHCVAPDATVALCVGRGPDMVMAMLAILKAGGAYLPLDPDYPVERLAYILSHARPVAIICAEQSNARIAEAVGTAGTPVINLDRDSVKWQAEDNGDLPCVISGVAPRHLAYVMYTSGSTGRPKGVMVEHRSVVNQVTALQRRYGLVAQDRVLQFAAPSFDMSVEEIFGALASGAALVLRTDAWLAGAAEFHGLCNAYAVSVANLPPMVWEQFLQREDKELPPSLRCVMLGGDAVHPEAIRRWLARTGHRPRLFNAYGPTEATVNATVHEPGIYDDGRQLIGRPLANTRIYIVDAGLRPVPVGVVGEICIGGAGVARGYLANAELTDRSFVADPFYAGFSARMYRTGDLGRYLHDGTVEFLGRRDAQVKIRGFRIELGEVEATLERHPEVRSAAAVAVDDPVSGRRLVACYTPRNEPADPQSLRRFLADFLPEYMVPTQFVALDALPLTPNGKLDRTALTQQVSVGAPQHGLESDYQAPQGEVEIRIAQIWAEVLGLERVGRRDHFFELGGHSLLAISLIERMRRAGLHTDVRVLFDTPTLAELADAVGDAHAIVAVPPNRIHPGCEVITPEMLPLVHLSEANIGDIVRHVPGGATNIQDIYPLAPLQEGILFHHMMEEEGDPYLLHGLYSFDSRDRLGRFVKALQTVVDRHDILRTAVLWEGLPEPVQVVWRTARIEIEEVTFDPAQGDPAAQLEARFDPRRYRLDVRRAPMIRLFAMYDAANSRWLALLLNHHLAGDHTTQDVVVNEVRTCLQGQAAHLPAPLPFRNFVVQARQAVSPEEHEAFFSRMLADVDQPTAPFGLTDVRGDGTDIVEAGLDVETGLAARIRKRAQAMGVSAATLCHLAWARVLAQLTGRDDVVFGTVLFGRMQGGEGADRALGLFMNTLPVRIDMRERSVQDGVRHTHALLTQLLRHEHASLALAQRCSAVPSSTPLFSAFFNYRHSVPVAASGDTPDGWEGIKALGGQERTNYPLTFSVDDLGNAFYLTAQVELPIQPERICAYMHAALEKLIDALEEAPQSPVAGLDVLPPAERMLVVDGWNATQRTGREGRF